LLPDETVVDSFTDWAHDAEPKLRRALIASFGPQIGRDAAAEALSYVWEHWDRVGRMENPIGYAYATGRDRARRILRRRRPVLMALPSGGLPDVEPGLPAALAHLPERQRTVLLLLHGQEWTMSEVAGLLGISKSTVQNHAERGLATLRRSLGVSE
jgi:DNA-directed RNA polymerase specialized sigma24 family protein